MASPSASGLAPSGAAVASDSGSIRYETAWQYIKATCPEVGNEFENDLVKKLGRLPPVNQLVCQGLREFKLSSSKPMISCNLKAALVQATGQPQKAENACAKCLKGDGLWVGCVRAPAGPLSNVVPGGGCANCMYQNHTKGCQPPSFPNYAMAPPLAQPPPSPAVASSFTSVPAVSTEQVPAVPVPTSLLRMPDSATTSSRITRLAESAYLSPYSRSGAPQPHPNTDPYAALRATALSTLEAMGYDPSTMVERGVVWAEDQDPFGHVMHSQYMHFLGTCFHRFMEGYDEFLSEKEYDDMIHARTVVPVIRKYKLNIRRQVKYPDSLIAAYRQDRIEPTRNSGTTSLFSLKQQAVVAEVKGSVTYMEVRTGHPVDIRTLGGGWPALYDGLSTKSERANALKAGWESRRPSTPKI